MPSVLVPSGKSTEDDVRVGSVSRPGGAKPIRCMETTRYLSLKHRTDPLRLFDTHDKTELRRELTVPEEAPGPAGKEERERGDKRLSGRN